MSLPCDQLVCLPRKTKKLQKKGIWSFLRHLTLIFYLSKVIKTIFPQGIFDVKFPALFKSAVKNRGPHLRKGSYLHLTLKTDLKVKIDGTVKCPLRPWSTFVRTIFSQIKYFRRYLGLYIEMVHRVCLSELCSMLNIAIEIQ